MTSQYLHELTVFRKGEHDHQVDSTAQMLDWLKQAGREPGGMLQLVEERALELRRGQSGSGAPVRLRAPPGVSAVQLLSGTRRTVAAGRRTFPIRFRLTKPHCEDRGSCR
jgi:hypothetical protein